MAKLTAWLVTLVGALWVLHLFGLTAGASPVSGWMGWLVALSFLAIGIGKLQRNYAKRKK